VNQLTKVRAVETVLRIYHFLERVSLGTRASEAASIDGAWAYGRNFSVSELGRGHVIRLEMYMNGYYHGA